MNDLAVARTYLQCGLRIRSEIEIALPEIEDDGHDVDVRWGLDLDEWVESPPGPVIASYGEGSTAWYTVSRAHPGYVIRFRRCGEFVVADDLASIEVRRFPEGRHELLPVLLAGTVSAILLTLRGSTVLHASAVELRGRSLAFVGPSGRGKTTLAALMCVGGARLVTDDVLVVDAGPPVTCVGGAPELRLREKAAEIAAMSPRSRTRHTEDDRLAFTPELAPPLPFELSAIVIPEPSRTVGAVVTERMTPSDALFALLSFPRVHQWNRADVLTREFTMVSNLVNEVPVHRAVIPWGPPFSRDIAPALSQVAFDDPGSSGLGVSDS